MPLREGLLEPISGENPAGLDLRYDPLYEQIKEARREEEEFALSAEGRKEIRDVWQHQRKLADWKLTQKLCEDALQKRAKDLQVAAWLTEALLKRDGFSGLRQGLDLMRGLIEQFWDHLYPELEDGDSELRAVAVQWVATRLDLSVRMAPMVKGGHGFLKYKEMSSVPTEEEANQDEAKRQKREAAVADQKFTPEDWQAAVKETTVEALVGLAEELQGLKESVDKLDRLSTEKFGEYAAGFGDLRELLQQVANVTRLLVEEKGGSLNLGGAGVVEEAPAAAASAANPDAWLDQFTSSGAPGAVATAAPAQRAAVTQTAEPTSMEDAVQRVAAVANWMRQQNANNPAPFLMLRGLRFGELRGGGSSPDWTLLEAPPTEVRQQLKKLQQEYQNDELIKASEGAMAMPCGRAWLDLQRFAIAGCEGAGNSVVAEAIKSEVKGLLADYPALLEMTLTDDTPAANAQTKEFFKERGMLPLPPPPPPAEAMPEPEPVWQPEPQRGAVEEYSEPDDEQLIRDALRAGRVEEALGMISRKLATEVSGRGRFQRKIQIGQVLMSAGRAQVAYPVLKELVHEIDQRHLDQWESTDLITQPLVLYYRCLERIGGQEEEKQRVFALVSRLDPVRAFELA